MFSRLMRSNRAVVVCRNAVISVAIAHSCGIKELLSLSLLLHNSFQILLSACENTIIVVS